MSTCCCPTQYRSLMYLVPACKASKKQIWTRKLTAQAIEFCTPQRPKGAWFGGVLWRFVASRASWVWRIGESLWRQLLRCSQHYFQISSHLSIVLLPPSSYLLFNSLWRVSQPDLYSGLAEITVLHENRRNAGIVDPELVCAHSTPNQTPPQHLVLITNCITRR